jgi:hypothetical protein
MRTLTLAALAMLGFEVSACGASVVLKPPIMSACEESGLKGCEHLTEGVLLFVEGDKQQGVKKLKNAAAENSPEKVKMFARALLLLKNIPGTGAYMQPVFEVAGILAGEDVARESKVEKQAEEGAKSSKTTASRKATDQGDDDRDLPARGERRPHAGEPHGLDRVLTADTDPSRLETHLVEPAKSRQLKPCGHVAPDGWQCVVLVPGPVVVTDLASTMSKNCILRVGASDWVDDTALPSWVLIAPFDLHATRLVARAGESFFVAIEPGADNPYASSPKSCALLWAGFQPYTKADLEKEQGADKWPGGQK